MKIYPSFGSFVSVVGMSLMIATQSIATDANTLTGTGHISLTFDTNVGEPPLPAGSHFFWRPHSLFIGNLSAPGGMAYDSVTLLGQGASEAVAILGVAGEYGTAVGHGSIASGAVALGRGAQALSPYSIAIASTGDGGSQPALTTGDGAIAIGWFSKGLAPKAIALGYSVTSTGDFSAAVGASSNAMGDRSFALGYLATAVADEAVALGRSVYASAYGSIALGYYNKGNKRKDDTTDVDPVTPHPDDPLLTLGKGSSTTPANAFTVYRDGTVRLSKAAGGISMGQFN